MNTKELIEKLSSRLEVSKEQGKRIVTLVCELIQQGLLEDGEVGLYGLGRWVSVVRAARAGVDPKRKQKILIPEKKVVKFKAASAWQKAIEGQGESQ